MRERVGDFDFASQQECHNFRSSVRSQCFAA